MPQKVILVDALPGDSTGVYAHYENRRSDRSGWAARDIRAIVAACEDEWMAQLDVWHRELCRRGAARSWNWWLLPASRLAAWYPVDLKPLLFALGVTECLRRQPSPTLFLVGVPDDVGRYLDEWRAQHGSPDPVVLIDRRARARFSGVRTCVTGVIAPWLDGVVRLRSLVARAVLGRTSDEVGGRARLLVFSHTLTAAAMQRGGDHFFGRVFDRGSKDDSDSVHWFYHLSLFRERGAVREFARSIGRRISFDFDWLRWTDILRVIGDAIQLRLRMRGFEREVPALTVGGLRTAVFPRRFVASAVSGSVPITELAIYRSLKRCLRAVQPVSVVYPYEQKGLERAILRACAEHPSPVHTIAFAHALYNKGHRYLRYCADQPAPDVVGVTGPSALQWMIDWGGWPRSRLHLLGSPRAAVGNARPRDPHRGPLRVLFIIGIGPELEQLASLAEEQPDLFDGCDLVVRRYPYAWQAPQDRGLRRLADAGVRLSVDDRSLDQQVAWSDVVLFCSTSAGLEAILGGRVVIRVALDDIFDADPTAGKTDAQAVLRCGTAAELKVTLAEMAAATPESYATRAAAQRQFAEQVYSTFDASALESKGFR